MLNGELAGAEPGITTAGSILPFTLPTVWFWKKSPNNGVGFPFLSSAFRFFQFWLLAFIFLRFCFALC